MKTNALGAISPPVAILRYDHGRATYKTPERPLETPLFDADYIQRLADCDEQTERHFTVYFTDLLKIKLRFRIRSPQAMEDVQQETFLRVIRNLRKNPGSIEHPERLGAYVNAVCNNVLLELFRLEGRFRNWDDTADPADDRVDIDGDFVTAERKLQVTAILKELPEKDRELLKRVFLDEEDKDAVCRAFHVDRNYLRVLLHRAKARFKTNLVKGASNTR